MGKKNPSPSTILNKNNKIENISNLIELLQLRSGKQSDDTAYIFLEDGETKETQLTYEGLEMHARAIAASLQDIVKGGDRALLLYAPGLDYIKAFFGCIYSNVIAVPVYPPDPSRLEQSLNRLNAIIKNAEVSVVLTDSFIMKAAETILSGEEYWEKLKWIATDVLEPELSSLWKQPKIERDTLAFLQYTSGSTGNPKGVMVSHGNLLHNEKMIKKLMGHDKDTVVVGWLPLYHDMGLIGNVLQPMYLGVKCILMSPISFLQKPARWMQAISRYRATTSGGPNFSYELCVKRTTEQELTGIDLSSWTVAYNGAEPIQKITLDRFAERFAPYGFNPDAIFPCYGLAEATLIVTGSEKLKSPILFNARKDEVGNDTVIETVEPGNTSITYIGCGSSCFGEEVIIVDPETMEPCSSGQIGEIWINGENVTHGYWNNPEETEYTFNACLNTGEGPFLRTGDLGFLNRENLFVTGRIKDVIILHGQNHYPQDIEIIVEQSHPALRPGCTAAFSVSGSGEEHLMVITEVRSKKLEGLDLDEVINSIREAIFNALSLPVYGVVLIQERTIPKTSSGKIQRGQCKQFLLEWNLPVIKINILDQSQDRVKKNIILNRLIELDKPIERLPILEHYIQQKIAGALDIPMARVDLKKPLASLGVDSLMGIQLKIEFEESLGIELDMKKLIKEDKSIANLALIIADLLHEDSVSLQSGKEGIGHKLKAKESQKIFLESLVEYSLQSTSLEMQLYNSINDLPVEKWDEVALMSYVGLDSQHLKAIEKSGINNIEPYYLLILDDEKPAGISYFTVFELDLLKLSDIPDAVHNTLRTWAPGFLRMKVLEWGLISALGEPIVCTDDRLLYSSLRSITKEIEERAVGDNVDFILMRDIPYYRYNIYKTLEDLGYVYILGFPAAKLEIIWNSFDEYIESLKFKTRWNYKNIVSAIDNEDITIEVINDFGEHADRLEALWGQVNRRSTEYEHEILTSSYFRELNQCLPDRSHIIAFKRKGEIIAYFLCLEGDEEYFGVQIGIDYKYNDEYKLYFNLYYPVIEEAIKRGKKRINFGITTYDYKCRIGSELEPLGYFIKHIKVPQYTPALAELLRSSIEQPENVHRPFKEQNISDRMNLKEIANEIDFLKSRNNLDVFHTARTYLRANILRLTGLYSFFPSFESVQDPVIMYKGKEIMMLGTNSYLGFNSDRELIEPVKRAIDKYGTGCSGSPVLNGTLDIHIELCKSLAEFIGKEDAILFSTGFQTNLGVISTILNSDCVAVIDELDHASLIDGVLLSGAKISLYKHNNIDSLEKALMKYPDKPKMVITDSVFSMEGTMVDLPEIVRLSKKYNARIMLDEAHAIGVLGPGGRGVAEHYGLLNDIDLIMGTFSKSFASVGGFIAGEAGVIDYLRHSSRSHMFSASLPPSAVVTVKEVLEYIKKYPERGKKALENAKYMAENLQQLGYDAPYMNTAIVPVRCGHEILTLALYKNLLERGVFVNPVLFPAVPKGQEQLRTSYMATHTEVILRRALKVFEQLRTPDFPRAKN